MNTQDPDQARDDDGGRSSPDSLFDGELDDASAADGAADAPPARRAPPPVPGLFFDPGFRVPESLARDVYAFCKSTYFRSRGADQVMLFERAPIPRRSDEARESPSTSFSLPAALLTLLHTLSVQLSPHLPPSTRDLLFPAAPTRARQIIINLYAPGEGISAHVDLLRRYGDGIIGVSLGSGCVMRFRDVGNDGAAHESYNPVTDNDANPDHPTHDVYLPAGSVYVMTGDARYRWTHGIERRRADLVEAGTGEGAEWIERGERISVTFRWMLEGGDVL
ncbi:hypothetical protein HDZ31DRAFT_84161 [Schizophyllum fasciatum]